MFRDFKGWSEFHQTSQIHDSDFIANVLDDVQIVSDYQIGQIQLFLQVKQQIENLCLYGYVKGTGRLIENHHFWIQCQRSCDSNSLQLTAG